MPELWTARGICRLPHAFGLGQHEDGFVDEIRFVVHLFKDVADFGGGVETVGLCGGFLRPAPTLYPPRLLFSFVSITFAFEI